MFKAIKRMFAAVNDNDADVRAIGEDLLKNNAVDYLMTKTMM